MPGTRQDRLRGKRAALVTAHTRSGRSLVSEAPCSLSLLQTRQLIEMGSPSSPPNSHRAIAPLGSEMVTRSMIMMPSSMANFLRVRCYPGNATKIVAEDDAREELLTIQFVSTAKRP